MEKFKKIIKNRATWAFIGVVIGQFAPNLTPYVSMIGTVVGA